MINELIEKLAPYLDQYKLKFIDNNSMLSINGTSYFDLKNYESLEQDDTTIKIKAKGYNITLFKNVDCIYSVTY